MIINLEEYREKLRKEIFGRIDSSLAEQDRYLSESDESQLNNPKTIIQTYVQDFLIERYRKGNEIVGLLRAYSLLIPEEELTQELEKLVKGYTKADKKFIMERWRMAELGNHLYQIVTSKQKENSNGGKK